MREGFGLSSGGEALGFRGGSKGRTLTGPSADSCQRFSPGGRISFARVKIAVCVKEVPETSAAKRFEAESFRLDRSGPNTLNEFDTHAVEEGLKARDAGGEGEVVAVLMGPDRSADSLRKALAMGADRSVHVTDDSLAGSDLVATSRALAKALERENANLILFGQQGADSDGAVLWAAVADRLRLPMISQAASLEVTDGKAKVKRQTEYGYDVIEAPLPCVVAVSDAINEPRYPSLKGIMGAKKKPHDRLGVSDLGLQAGDVGVQGSRTEVRGLGEPPQRGDSLKIEDEGDAAERIVEFLAERKLV
jgi:electron transfer flavoprotein beta subunit